MQAADIVFIIISTALVMLMTPGLALFYGGMVNKKNVLSTTMHSYTAMILISIQWVVVGYSLAFSGNHFGIIGDLHWINLKDVTLNANISYAPTIPHQLFMLFQMMFATITPALISGSLAERIRYKVFVIFIVVWSLLVYDPIAHWVWGTGGFLKNLGALDFAGGNVVHITSGIAGLVGAIVIGKRNAKANEGPHHIPMTILGAGLLWFGWFGFNAGSALGVTGDNGAIAVTAILTTNVSAAAGGIGWALTEYFFTKKVKVTGTITGAIVGLVSITPGAGFVSPISSLLIGFIGGIICFVSVSKLKQKLKYDDALDAFGCHGIGGIWGGIAVGLFADKSVNEAGANGLFYGNPSQLGIQMIAILVTVVYVGIATFVILKAIALFTSLRADEEHEEEGLDMALHGEEAYSLDGEGSYGYQI